MKPKVQLRRKLVFQPPRPRLINGLRVGTYVFYLARREKTVLNMERTDFPGDLDYCLDRAMPEPLEVHKFKPQKGGTLRFLGMDVNVDPALGDRMLILPHNPNRPMFWIDSESSFSQDAVRNFFSGSGGT